MTPKVLRQCGEAMHGAEWQRALARDLGPLHPDGAKLAIDDSLIRKWARAARPIPSWVGPALEILLRRCVEGEALRIAHLQNALESVGREDVET